MCGPDQKTKEVMMSLKVSKILAVFMAGAITYKGYYQSICQVRICPGCYSKSRLFLQMNLQDGITRYLKAVAKFVL